MCSFVQYIEWRPVFEKDASRFRMDWCLVSEKDASSCEKKVGALFLRKRAQHASELAQHASELPGSRPTSQAARLGSRTTWPVVSMVVCHIVLQGGVVMSGVVSVQRKAWIEVQLLCYHE